MLRIGAGLENKRMLYFHHANQCDIKDTYTLVLQYSKETSAEKRKLNKLM